MAIGARKVRYHHKYRFRVEIDGFTSAAFMKCSALEAEVGVVEVKEGGSLITHKEAGMVTYKDVTLERGVTDDRQCYDWFTEVAEGHRDVGRGTPDYYRNVEIVQLDRPGNEIARWALEEAWPNTFVAGEWDNDTNESVVERLTLSISLFRRVDE